MPGLGATERRTLGAIATAMAPGLDRLPPADAVGSVAAIEPLVRALPRRTRTGLRLLLLAIEWSTFPRRFSRLGPDDRAARLSGWERSRIAWRRDLALAAKLLFNLGYASREPVRAAVGERSACEAEDPPPPPQLGDTAPPAGGEQCEIAIVGSGAGGAVAAATLAEAGHDVLVLEAGPVASAESYPADPVEAVARLYRDGGLTLTEGRPAIAVPVGQVVGGTTVINSGTCFRAPPHVLHHWAEANGIGWTGSLEPHFSAAEDFLRVTPVDPERMGRNGRLAMEGAAALGASSGPISRNAGNCSQCSSCPVGCRLDAKRGMHVSYLPRAVAAGARLRANVRVDRITLEDGRARGLECTANGPSGPRPHTITADRIVLAAGAIGTPELLSSSGLGGGHVGRNLRVHPAAWIGARHPEPVRGWEGVMQSYYIDEWADRGILLEATFTPMTFGGAWLPGAGADHQRALLSLDHVASIGVHLSDRSSGRVRAGSRGTRLTYRLEADDVARLHFGIARAAEIHFAAGATEVYPNVAGRTVLEQHELDSFEHARVRAKHLRLEAFHPMGTARMDANPARGACAPDGSVHGVPGLYVADASLFPSSVGVNPMMTVIAFAGRIAAEMS